MTLSRYIGWKCQDMNLKAWPRWKYLVFWFRWWVEGLTLEEKKENNEKWKWSQERTHPLLYLKWITNKDLLYSTGNSAQWYVAAWMRGEFGGQWIHGYVWLNPFTVHLNLLQHCQSAIPQYKINGSKQKWYQEFLQVNGKINLVNITKNFYKWMGR